MYEVNLRLNHLHSSFLPPFTWSNQPLLIPASCKDSYRASVGIHNNHLILLLLIRKPLYNEILSLVYSLLSDQIYGKDQFVSNSM